MFADQIKSNAAASECNCTFSGVKRLFVFWVKIYWALRTSGALKVLGVIYMRSTLKDCLPSMSFAVFQLTCLKPLRQTTILSVFSTSGCGFAVDRSSTIEALVKASILSSTSFYALKRS